MKLSLEQAQIRDRIVGAFGSPQVAKQLIETWASSNGLDTSKAYEFFRPKHARQPWQAMIWQAYIPPKFTFILWLGIRERLSTRDRLAFLQEETSCSLCINRSESAKHLFFDCPFSERVPKMAWHQPPYVNHPMCNQMAKERED
ncbi:hypothetical protein Salat_0514200 [Sesamum alatum]|uniref:Reverse transcriptase zinc-binding domain-containing protein n=1 Tax=Sesamum alatum TaxID=300844 RepID=A0AAE1Z5G8_9LAMI|nr:hypothetical protein Salat_0514200 [Sesamum alatum]